MEDIVSSFGADSSLLRDGFDCYMAKGGCAISTG